MLRWDPEDRVAVQLDILESAGLGLMVLVDMPKNTEIAWMFQQEDITHVWEEEAIEVKKGVYAKTTGSDNPSFGAYCNSVKQFKKTQFKYKEDQKRLTNGNIAVKRDGLMVAKATRPIKRGEFVYLDYGPSYQI